MTQQRQQRKVGRRRPSLRSLIATAFLAASVTAAVAMTERVVVNRTTGAAIDGVDPVAYFAQGQPTPGRADYEAVHDGAIWRFRNEGNRAAFLASPATYAPRFGGYDPVDVARGVPVAGNPTIWRIDAGGLFLFSSERSRQTFAADTEKLSTRAHQRWPELLAILGE